MLIYTGKPVANVGHYMRLIFCILSFFVDQRKRRQLITNQEEKLDDGTVTFSWDVDNTLRSDLRIAFDCRKLKPGSTSALITPGLKDMYQLQVAISPTGDQLNFSCTNPVPTITVPIQQAQVAKV